MGTLQEFGGLSEPASGIPAALEESHPYMVGESADAPMRSSTDIDRRLWPSSATFSISFSRSSSFILSRPLSNICYSFCLRNFFYCRKRFNFACFSRASSLAASQAASAAASSYSRRSIALLIPPKLTIGSAGSHFFPVRTHSPHFFDNDDSRHDFCCRAHRIQATIAIIPRRFTCSARDKRCEVFREDIGSSLRTKKKKEGGSCYDR